MLIRTSIYFSITNRQDRMSRFNDNMLTGNALDTLITASFPTVQEIRFSCTHVVIHFLLSQGKDRYVVVNGYCEP